MDTDQQIAAVWGQMLSAMTAQGATRADIAMMSTKTAGAILALTADALWEGKSAPEGEGDTAHRFNMALMWLDNPTPPETSPEDPTDGIPQPPPL